MEYLSLPGVDYLEALYGIFNLVDSEARVRAARGMSRSGARAARAAHERTVA